MLRYGWCGRAVVAAAVTHVKLPWPVLGECRQLETDLVAVERVLEYCSLPDEEDVVVMAAPSPSGDDPGPPTAGLAIDALRFRYAPELPWVLKSLRLAVPPGSKVAIIGRTGSGKSSLALALLRLYSCEGSIRLGDFQWAGHRARDVRCSVRALLQDAVLFSGTVRENLCGPHTYSDAALWDALRRVRMEDAIQRLPKVT